MSWGVDNNTNRLLYKYLIQLEQMKAGWASTDWSHVITWNKIFKQTSTRQHRYQHSLYMYYIYNIYCKYISFISVYIMELVGKSMLCFYTDIDISDRRFIVMKYPFLGGDSNIITDIFIRFNWVVIECGAVVEPSSQWDECCDQSDHRESAYCHSVTHLLPLGLFDDVLGLTGLTPLTRLLRQDRHLTQVLVDPLARPHTSHRTGQGWVRAESGLLRNNSLQLWTGAGIGRRVR